MPDSAPLVRIREAFVPNVAAASDADQVVGEAPYDGTVTAVTWVPEAAVTGANTETRTFTLVNKGQAGVGTTVIATLAMTSGVNAVAFDEKAATLSVVAGATSVAAGDVVLWVSTHSGSTGLADPGGTVRVEFTRS